MENSIFYLGLSLIWTHELDAIRRREWKIFYIIGDWEEETAYWFWIIAHIPLFYLSYVLLDSATAENIQFYGRLSLDGFFMIHLVLHLLLANHKENRFQSIGSKILVWCIGVCGLIDLGFILR